jgi:hypothetical protein
MPKKKSLNRSIKLKKYEKVYKSFIRKTEQSKISKSPRISRTKTENILKKEIKPKKTLNDYQKFVKSESKHEKYKDLPGKLRLAAIANNWKKINKN